MKKSRGITIIELFVIVTTAVLIISVIYSQIVSARKRGQIALVEKAAEKMLTQIEVARGDYGGNFGERVIRGETLTECTQDGTVFKSLATPLAQIMTVDGHISCSITQNAWAVAFDVSYIHEDDKDYTQSTACFDSEGYDIVGVDLPGAYKWNEAIDQVTSTCIPPYGK